MKSIIHTLIGTGIVVAIAGCPAVALAASHQTVPTPLPHLIVPPSERQTGDQTVISQIDPSPLSTPRRLAPSTSTRHVSSRNIDPSMTIASSSNRRQPRSSNHAAFDWMWMIVFLSFSGFIVWRFLTQTSSDHQRSSDNSWFDFGSHDSDADSSSYSDYGNYSDSSDFGGGGDGGDW